MRTVARMLLHTAHDQGAGREGTPQAAQEGSTEHCVRAEGVVSGCCRRLGGSWVVDPCGMALSCCANTKTSFHSRASLFKTHGGDGW
jgi:hypothetical protein